MSQEIQRQLFDLYNPTDRPIPLVIKSIIIKGIYYKIKSNKEIRRSEKNFQYELR